MKLTGWGHTDTGRKRSHNEDSFLVEIDVGLFAVADGMGGHRGGATASRMAMEVMKRKLKEAAGNLLGAAELIEASPNMIAFADTGVISTTHLDTTPALPPQNPLVEPISDGIPQMGLEPTLEFSIPPPIIVMRAAAEEASYDIHEKAATDRNLRGMGTTLTAMLYDEGQMYLIHAGDSRAYLLRCGKLTQLTEDHTWIAEQMKSGAMTEEEAKQSKYRHVITRSVGFERTVELDTYVLEVEPGDCFLLCSDGMSNHIENREIEAVMNKTYARHAPARLIEMANDRGGDDNITVVTVYVGNHTPQADASTKTSGQ